MLSGMNEKTEQGVKKKLKKVLFVLMLLGGIGMLLYPDIASWYNGRHQREMVQEFNDNVSRLPEELIEEHVRRAREYNELLTGIAITDPFVVGSGAVLPAPDYLEIMNINGVMGQVEIPAIDVLLPIFHTTTDEVLNRGVGHIEGTSFPIGGIGSHAVLTGHSGLPHTRMFTDLEEIGIGDVFFVRVLNKTLAYEIDDINVVLPYEIETLRVRQDADFVTLITCTPYGINSHRLLLRGFRIPYTPEIREEVEVILGSVLNLRVMIILGFVGLLSVILITHKIMSRGGRRDEIEDAKELILRIMTEED
jgi:sortase A